MKIIFQHTNLVLRKKYSKIILYKHNKGCTFAKIHQKHLCFPFQNN
jgi:hypothetical protein